MIIFALTLGRHIESCQRTKTKQNLCFHRAHPPGRGQGNSAQAGLLEKEYSRPFPQKTGWKNKRTTALWTPYDCKIPMAGENSILNSRCGLTGLFIFQIKFFFFLFFLLCFFSITFTFFSSQLDVYYINLFHSSILTYIFSCLYFLQIYTLLQSFLHCYLYIYTSFSFLIILGRSLL